MNTTATMPPLFATIETSTDLPPNVALAVLESGRALIASDLDENEVAVKRAFAAYFAEVVAFGLDFDVLVLQPAVVDRSFQVITKAQINAYADLLN